MSLPESAATMSPDDPAAPSTDRSFPTGALIGVFVAVTILGLAFVGCGILRSRQQRRRQQMYMNHERVYAAGYLNPVLNKPLPSTHSYDRNNDTSNNRQGFGTTTNVYSTYSSGGGPPVYMKDVEDGTIQPPPPAYEPRRN